MPRLAKLGHIVVLRFKPIRARTALILRRERLNFVKRENKTNRIIAIRA